MQNGDLLSRLSTAPAGSRELDAEVAIACGWEYRVAEIGGRRRRREIWFVPGTECFDPPPLTTDLTTIVGEIERQGFDWMVEALKETPPGEQWPSTGGVYAGWWHVQEAATPCLALCIALLKAK